MTNKATKYGIMIIAAVLVIAMAFAGAGAATGEYVKVWNGTALQSLTNGGSASGSSGTATLTGTPGTTDPCVLELNGFVIDASATSTAIIDANVPNLTIKLVGDSNLTGSFSNTYQGVLYSSGNLTITTESDGKLLVNNTASSFGNAIYTPKDITIENGTVNATATGYLGDAIKTSKDVTIKAGIITLTATGVYGSPIYANKDVTIDGGKITAKSANAEASNFGIFADNDVTINNGEINVSSITGVAIYASTGNVTIKGGTINATSTQYSAIHAENEVTIEGGTIIATAGTQAIYSYGGLTITSVDQLTANGVNGAFEYKTARDFSALGNTYEYWVNATVGTEPTVKLTYEQFNADGNWTPDSNKMKSVYTNVLIKPIIFYPIYITNATGTYQLSSAMTEVYGDYGATNGTATLTLEDDKYVLTLDGFKASNMSNVPIINASVPNLTIKLVGDSNLTGSYNNGIKGLLFTSGKLTITGEDEGTLLVNNTVNSGEYCTIHAEDNLTITGGLVNAIASGGNGNAIFSNKEITISGGTINATADGNSIFAYMDIAISGGTINATADGYAINAGNDVTINDGTVTATVIGDGYPIYAANNVSIIDGTVTATSGQYAIRASNITIDGGTVNAIVNGYGDSDCAIKASNDVIIRGGTVYASAFNYAIYADKDVTITSVDQLTAHSSAYSSFAYGTQRDFSGLGDDYEYWVNSTTSSEQLVKLNYAEFDADENWIDDMGLNTSVYTHVLIKPVTTPTPTPKKHSTSKDMGSTVILTETVTPTPVPTATPAATTVPTIATVKPTAQQTQKSPAPVFGLIAGLGAAAVLLRLRK